MQAFLEWVTKINDAVNGAVWGLPGLILLIGTGILLTVGTKVFQVFHVGHWWKNTIASVFKKNSSATKTTDRKTISQFQALCAALAATVGTGNIAGVLLLLFAGMLFISSEGALIGIGYVMRNVALAFIPMGRAKHETFAKYRERKMSKVKKPGDHCVLLTGLVFMIVGVICLVIWMFL